MTTPEDPKKATSKLTPAKKSALYKPFCSPLITPTTTPNSVAKGPQINEENRNETPQKLSASQSKQHTPCRRVGLARPKKKLQSPFCSPLQQKFCSPVFKENELDLEVGDLKREQLSESFTNLKEKLVNQEDSSRILVAKENSSVSEVQSNGSQETFERDYTQISSSEEKQTLDEPTQISNSFIKEFSCTDLCDTKKQSGSTKKKKMKPDSHIPKLEPVQLGRFTTEEYLEEYERDPEKFAKSLNENNDSEDDFVPLMEIKEKANKRKRRKEYTAIYCPVSKVSKKLTVVLDRATLTTDSLIHSDEDEMFTCSPEDEKKQRQNLIELINQLKDDNLEKEKVFDRLQYCEVYKRKHDKGELERCAETWLSACRTGLRELLVKMQELGPIDMGQLVRKLRIPEHIVNRLNVV